MQARRFLKHHKFIYHKIASCANTKWFARILAQQITNISMVGIRDLVWLHSSSSRNSWRRQEGYLHVVMNTLQKQLAIIGDKFSLLGSPQGAN
jgi:hypothetical protein